MIEAHEMDGVTLVLLTGELDASSCAKTREMILGLINGSQPSLVLDLSGVDRLYAAGISTLLELHRTAARSGGRLICCGARPFVRELLRINLLDRILDLQSDLESALDTIRAAS